MGAARGQALAESALALPLLLLLVLGAVQLGLWDHAQFVVQVACQEGARVAAADGGSLGAGVQRAQALLVAGLGPTGAGVAVQGSEDDATVTLGARGSLPAILPWLGRNDLPLHARASVFREQFRAGTTGP
jgi:Flp pilus assembly protein TadG